MEASLSKHKDYCPTCGHVVAKERVNLSSLEFRCHIHNITDLVELINSKDYLYRYIKSSYRVKEFANQFLNDLEDKIDEAGEDDNPNLDTIKLWLLGFINNEDRSFPPKEIYLYKFLLEDCSDIDIPFGDFYNSYSQWVENPMSKNRVSRALLAFGIKTVIRRIFMDKMKSIIKITVSKEELLELGRKNGLANLTH